MVSASASALSESLPLQSDAQLDEAPLHLAIHMTSPLTLLALTPTSQPHTPLTRAAHKPHRYPSSILQAARPGAQHASSARPRRREEEADAKRPESAVRQEVAARLARRAPRDPHTAVPHRCRPRARHAAPQAVCELRVHRRCEVLPVWGVELWEDLR